MDKIKDEQIIKNSAGEQELPNSEDIQLILSVAKVQGIPESISNKLLAVKGKFLEIRGKNSEKRISY